MKRYLLVVFVFLLGCSSGDETPVSRFSSELAQLKEFFHIPGMAVIVVKNDTILYEDYLGLADVAAQVPMDSTTVIPMASLTKIFTGAVIAQLSQRGVLEHPINAYVLDQNVGDSVKVKHVLSHTSEGEVGKHFHYSSRFSWLTKVIQLHYEGPYEGVVNYSITAPYDLRNTFLLGKEEQLEKRKYAKPYVYEGEIKPGFIDYGISASAGVTSTVRDLAKFSKMISNTLVETDRQQGQLYNYGLFSQEIEDNRVLWAYGQFDCYSSLFVKVPDKNFTFIVAGNNSLISDPARMIYGDIRTSLFALSFFKNFLGLDLPNEHLKARAVAESYMAMFDAKSAEKSKALLREVFKSGADYNSLTTMHTISFLKEIAKRRGEQFEEFDPQLRSIGEKLLVLDKNNPYANIYMASYYDSRNEVDSARIFFSRVAEARNATRGWYTNEAEEWLKQHGATSAPGTTTPLRE